MTTAETLNQRQETYGEFEDLAQIAQDIKRAMNRGNWGGLADDQKEALEVIATKIARILNGDPNHVDSWHDIAGYAELITNRLRKAVPNPHHQGEPRLDTVTHHAAYFAEAEGPAGCALLAVPPLGDRCFLKTE